MASSDKDTGGKSKIDLRGSNLATPGGKGEKRDATSPPIPPNPQPEKKTREGSSGHVEEQVEVDDQDSFGSPPPVHVFSKPMHPNDIVQIVSELRALMIPEIRTIVRDNTPDMETIVYSAVKKATDSITKQLNTVVAENFSLKERCSDLENRVAELELGNTTRRLETDALEQYGRRNILRVSGIPELPDEDTDDLILHLASDLGVTLRPSEIDRSHRVGKPSDETISQQKKSKKKNRDIIVKFTSYNARSKLFNKRKQLRETEDEDLKRIFLNEDLTKRRSEILFEARNLRRANKLKAAYSSDGKVLVRDKKDKKQQISDLEDLVQYGYVKKPDAPRGPVSTPAPMPMEAEPSTSGASAMD